MERRSYKHARVSLLAAVAKSSCSRHRQHLLVLRWWVHISLFVGLTKTVQNRFQNGMPIIIEDLAKKTSA